MSPRTRLMPVAAICFGQRVHRIVVVPEARAERRIADAAQIEIAVQRSVGADRAVAQHGRVKRVVGSETIERDGRRVHLHRRRRLHHRVGVLREERVAARQRHDDRAPFAAARVMRQGVRDRVGERDGAARGRPRRRGRHRRLRRRRGARRRRRPLLLRRAALRVADDARQATANAAKQATRPARLNSSRVHRRANGQHRYSYTQTLKKILLRYSTYRIPNQNSTKQIANASDAFTGSSHERNNTL